MSIGCVFACPGIGEDDFQVCTWWYGGETLAPGTCIVFDMAGQDGLCTVTPYSGGVVGDIELAGEGMFDSSEKRRLNDLRGTKEEVEL